MTVYLDNAASTPIDDAVWEYMLSLREHYGNPSCHHAMGRKARDIIETAREIVAKKINAEPEEIIFTSGGTESNNMALKGFCDICDGGHIISTAIEHISILEPLSYLYENGYDVTLLPVNMHGIVDTFAIENVIHTLHSDTILISTIYANNEIGTINNIGAIGEIAKRHGIAFHTDAIAAFPHMDIDVKALGVDLMSLSAHKLGGMKGCGALYVSRDLDIEPLIFGGVQEWNLRAGTENVLSIAAMGKAVEVLERNNHANTLADKLKQGILSNIPSAHINNHDSILPIINVRFDGVDGAWLVQTLSDKDIYCSQGSCSNRGVSHVLHNIGLTKEQAQSSIRFSVGRQNTLEEINHVVETLSTLLS